MSYYFYTPRLISVLYDFKFYCMNLGLDIRKEILMYSLLIESFTSTLLIGLLGVKNPLDSKTLGNKSTAFSFNEKICLLIDIGVLDSTTRNKFQFFMQIRNQFMHNIEASTYINCFKYIEGGVNFLSNNYPNEFNKGQEEEIREATLALTKEVFRITGDIMKHLEAKIAKDAEYEMLKATQQVLIDHIAQLNDQK